MINCQQSALESERLFETQHTVTAMKHVYIKVDVAAYLEDQPTSARKLSKFWHHLVSMGMSTVVV